MLYPFRSSWIQSSLMVDLEVPASTVRPDGAM